MRILVVAMPNSVHVARWLNQIAKQGWDIHFFPCYEAPPHSLLRNITLHAPIRPEHGSIHPSIRQQPPPDALVDRDPATRLAAVIARLAPDIVHSMELQHSSYLTLDAYDQYSGRFPCWIASNWGSDIYLFGRLPLHAERIKKLLASCDFYSCECCRDVKLARQFGFQGEILPVFPVAGGFDLTHTAELRSSGAPSARRVVVLKGYQHWAGRALVGLRALELCAEELRQGYRVEVYSRSSSDVALAAELFSANTGVPVDLLDFQSHDDMLRLFGRARVYLGLSISDGISTSLLEAVVMGTFPVQSYTSCADEWIVNGETGFLVPPEDPQIVAAALRRALTDDALVDSAALRNTILCQERLDVRKIAPQVIKLYQSVMDRISSTRPKSVEVNTNQAEQSIAPAKDREAEAAPSCPSAHGWIRRKARRVLALGRRGASVLKRRGCKLFMAKLLRKVGGRLVQFAQRLGA